MINYYEKYNIIEFVQNIYNYIYNKKYYLQLFMIKNISL